MLVGINYFGQRNELKGCINDVYNMQRFICDRFHYDRRNMVLLTDDQRDVNFQPTKTNIINAIKWLVGGAQQGDFLFFHFSGHGGFVRDRSGDEVDGFDSCIYPVDHDSAGSLIDDDMHEMMIKYLPMGVRLTVVFDCCHSGTGLDLPYVYNADGSLKQYNPGKSLAKSLLSTGNQLIRGNTVGAAVTLVSNMLSSVSGSRVEANAQRTRSAMADVIMFAGCKDDQTSADTFISGYGSTGAMSYALIKAIVESPANQTYLSLLGHVRQILRSQYSQKPQLSTGKPMDMNAYVFI